PKTTKSSIELTAVSLGLSVEGRGMSYRSSPRARGNNMKFRCLLLCALVIGFCADGLAQKSGPVMEEMTSAEIDQALKGGVDTAIVPVGATEQHGKHLATASDSV